MINKFVRFPYFFTLIFFLLFAFSLCYNNNCNSYFDYLFKSNFFPLPQISSEVPSSTGNSLLPPLNSLQTTFDQSKDGTNIVFIADSHSNNSVFPILGKSLDRFNPRYIIHTGDLTDFGDFENLFNAKSSLDSLGIDYIAMPGDHDIAQTSDLTNFNKVFSFPSGLSIQGIKILFIPNFKNFTPFREEEINYYIKSIPLSDIIVLSQPVLVPDNNIFSDKYMGSPTAFENLSNNQRESLKIYDLQRIRILNAIRNSQSPKLVISGDHHRSSTFEDPVNPKITYHILGGLAEYIYFGNQKISQNSLQSRRFTIVNFYKEDSNGTFKFSIQEVELN